MVSALKPVYSDGAATLLSLLVALRVHIAKLQQKLFSRGTAEGLHIGRCCTVRD